MLRATWLRNLGEHDNLYFYDQTEEPAGSWCAHVAQHSYLPERVELEEQLGRRPELQRRLCCALLSARARFPKSAEFVLVTPTVYVWWRRMCAYLDEVLGQQGYGEVPLLIAHATPRAQVLALKHALANASEGMHSSAFEQSSARLTNDLAFRASVHLGSSATVVNNAGAFAVSEADLAACEGRISSPPLSNHPFAHKAAGAESAGNRPAAHLLAFCLAASLHGGGAGTGGGEPGGQAYPARRSAARVGAESDMFASVPAGSTLERFTALYEGTERRQPWKRPALRCVPTLRKPVLLAGLTSAEFYTVHKAAGAGASGDGSAEGSERAGGGRGWLRTVSSLHMAQLRTGSCAPCTLIPSQFSSAFNGSRKDSLVVMIQFPVLNRATLAFDRPTDSARSRAWLRLELRAQMRPLFYLRPVLLHLSLQATSLRDVRAHGRKEGTAFGANVKSHLMGKSGALQRAGGGVGTMVVGRFLPRPDSRTTLVDLTEPLRALLGERSDAYPFFTLFLNVRCDTTAKDLFHQADDYLSADEWRKALAPRLVFQQIEQVRKGGARSVLCGTNLNGGGNRYLNDVA